MCASDYAITSECVYRWYRFVVDVQYTRMYLSYRGVLHLHTACTRIQYMLVDFNAPKINMYYIYVMYCAFQLEWGFQLATITITTYSFAAFNLSSSYKFVEKLCGCFRNLLSQTRIHHMLLRNRPNDSCSPLMFVSAYPRVT